MIGLSEKTMSSFNNGRPKKRVKVGELFTVGIVETSEFVSPKGHGIPVTGYTVSKNTAIEFIDRNLVPFLNAIYHEYGEKHTVAKAGCAFLEALQNLRKESSK